MTAARVYTAIASVMAEFSRSGIAKSRTNLEEGYAFRGIDDVYNRLAPLLSKHRLCILPRVLERTDSERRSTNDVMLLSVTLKVAFDIVSVRDGSSHTIEVYGEALDSGDKATSKAMSAAFKYAVLQAFCIPLQGSDDADSHTYRLASNGDQPDPVQGWDQWSLDIQELVGICETDEALDRVQTTHRLTLRSASKRRPDIYNAIGDAVRTRRQSLSSLLDINLQRRSRVNGAEAIGAEVHA